MFASETCTKFRKYTVFWFQITYILYKYIIIYTIIIYSFTVEDILLQIFLSCYSEDKVKKVTETHLKVSYCWNQLELTFEASQVLFNLQ